MSDFTSAQADTAIETALESYETPAETAQEATTAAVPAAKPAREESKLSQDYDPQTVEGKLLDAVYEPRNQVIDLINSFRSMGDLDTLAKNEIETAPEGSDIAALRDRVKLMKEKIAETEKLLIETSRASAAEKLDPDFDELKARVEIKETRAHAAEMYKIALATFEVLGHVDVIRDPLGKSEYEATNDAGEALLNAQYIPNIKGTKGSAPQGDSKTTLVREWAKANGHDVSDRGRIAADIIAAYDAAQ